MPVLPNPDYLSHPKLKSMRGELTREDIAQGLARFLPAFERNFAEWLKHGAPDFDVRISARGGVLADIQEQGFSLRRVAPTLKAKIAAWVHAAHEELEGKIARLEGKPKFRDMNVSLERSTHAELYDLVWEALEEHQFSAAATAYLGRPVSIKKLFAQVNNERETAIRYGALDEDGLPRLKSEYWHIDSDIWPSLKVIIYVNEVGLEQGPFRYVAGSHRTTPPFEMIVRKTNDALKLPQSLFVALPEELRMHALFGPYLTGDEPEVAALLARERVLCGDDLDLVLFDNNGVHRGGFVRSGTRHIVQCLFEAA